MTSVLSAVASMFGAAVGYFIVYHMHKWYMEREDKTPDTIKLGRCGVCGQFVDMSDPASMEYHNSMNHNAQQLH